MNARNRTRWASLGLAAVAALALGACGDDDEGPIPQTGIPQTTTTTASTTTASTTTTTTPATTEMGASAGR